MARRSNVPKFGNWEQGDVPYTVYFDKARKGSSGGKMINPNDPQENPDMFPNIAPAQAPPSRNRTLPEEPMGRGAVRPTYGRQTNREDGNVRQLTHSTLRNDNRGRRAASEPTHQHIGGRRLSSGQPARQSTESEHSFDRSPLHPHYQTKNSDDSSHGTPRRSRPKPIIRGNRSPDGVGAVPRFGAWDENDPSSADNFTYVFKNPRTERQNGVASVSGTGTKSTPNHIQRQNGNDSYKGCCFPWGRK